MRPLVHFFDPDFDTCWKMLFGTGPDVGLYLPYCGISLSFVKSAGYPDFDHDAGIAEKLCWRSLHARQHDIMLSCCQAIKCGMLLYCYSVKVAGKTDAPERTVALTARVPESFRRELRLYALQHDMTITELLVKAFDALKKTGK